MEEQTNQEQPEVEESQVENIPQSSALEERLAKLEGALTEQKGYVTKLEQENSTYRQIITDRGQSAPEVRKETVSEIDKEIDALEKQYEAGDLTAEELSVKSLKLIRKAKDQGKIEAVREVTNMYSQEQEISKKFNAIFEDEELKGMEKDLSDIAYGYFQAALSQGHNIAQASEYAKMNTKDKMKKFRERFGGKVEPKEQVKVSGSLKGEGESVKQTKKEEPVTHESSQEGFIALRRKKLAMR